MYERRDKCQSPTGVLFSGGYALVVVREVHKELLGKMVLLSHQDQFNWWHVYDRAGDLIILEEKSLMPISKKYWDKSPELDKLIYEARYGS